MSHSQKRFEFAIDEALISGQIDKMRDQIEQLARTYIMMKIQAVHCSVAIPMRQRIEELEKKIQKGNFSPPPD